MTRPSTAPNSASPLFLKAATGWLSTRSPLLYPVGLEVHAVAIGGAS
jgi:hypothetical protein